MRYAPALFFSLGITGCASTPVSPDGPLRVSVSAANYSQLSGEDLYSAVNAPDNLHPVPPAPAAPPRPLFYAFVPADYSPAVPLETVYRELAIPLAQRGYFNIVYQFRAGLAPGRIDYLLRFYCGRRYWLKATVRTDRFTWGNDGPVYSRLGTASSATANVIGPGADWDPRVGTSPAEITSLATNLQEGMGSMSRGNGSFAVQQGSDFREPEGEGASRFCYLLLIEAYRFDDVRARGNAAPCAWATFVSVPLRDGLGLVSVLRTMARASAPYLGATTAGVQLFELPPAKVPAGEP